MKKEIYFLLKSLLSSKINKHMEKKTTRIILKWIIPVVKLLGIPSQKVANIYWQSLKGDFLTSK